MTANTSSTHSPEAYRHAWETYAIAEFLKIQNMSEEDRKQSVDELRLACASKGLTWEEAKYIVQYPGGMTEKELELRAVLQKYFDPLQTDILQSHFTYFQRKERVITNLVTAQADESKKMKLECNGKAVNLIVDELGKSLIRKGIQPQVPPSAGQPKG